MSEKQITARVRDIKQEDIGIFRVELVAEALPDPRGFEVIHHPIQFKLATREWVMNNCLNLWGIGREPGSGDSTNDPARKLNSECRIPSSEKPSYARAQLHLI